MSELKNIVHLLLIGICAFLLIVLASHPPSQHHQPQTIIIKPPPSKPTVTPVPTLASSNTCPAPSENMIKCIREWACQYIIRLDLRCLLNLNGSPLLGGLLGGSGTPAVDRPIGGNSGILGGILGL